MPAVVSALAAVVLALGAEALVVLPCAYRSESVSVSTTPGGTPRMSRESSCASVLEREGRAAVLWLGIPALLAGCGLLSAALGGRAPQAVFGWTIVAAAFVGSILAFGLFPMLFAPAGVALVASAGVQEASA